MNTSERNPVSEEVLTVISAALAYLNVRPDHKLVVRSIKRVALTSPVWNVAGRIKGLR